jgi:hypothetical protein
MQQVLWGDLGGSEPSLHKSRPRSLNARPRHSSPSGAPKAEHAEDAQTVKGRSAVKGGGSIYARQSTYISTKKQGFLTLSALTPPVTG